MFYNPIHLTDKVRVSLSEFCGSEGVRFIVPPSEVHHVYLEEFVAKDAFPNAEVIASETMKGKHPKVSFAHILSDPTHLPTIPWGEDFSLVYLPDYVHKEILLMHHPSRSLLVADMVWNMPAVTAYSAVNVTASERDAPLQRWVDQVTPSTVVHHALVGLASGGAYGGASQRTLDGMRQIVTQWKPERIIVEHGEIIQHNGTGMLLEAWKWSRTFNFESEC
jgi:hypothetical protein